jgi:2-polyprenyl-3-methyl-5-hydroxy-6-metoxy-1,4-benzoquinol methylase
MTDPRQSMGVDVEALQAFSGLVWGYKQGQMVAFMIELGDRLGLFRALDGAGALSADELAERTGTHPRWTLEWLRSIGGARLLDHEVGPDGVDRFALSAVGSLVLAREGEVTFAAAAMQLPRPANFAERLTESFRTGIGLTYDELGVECAHHVERMLGPWAKALVVPVVIPALDGVQAKLERGAKVADVGCGAGLVLELLGKAFPASTFHGFDLSQHAVDAAQARCAAAGLTNVEVRRARAEELPADGEYDLVLTFDCIHDMVRPDLAIAAIRTALAADGTWLCKDIRSAPTFAGNLANPMVAMMYASSIVTCMSSAMSEPGGLGLGTLGFNPAVAEQMATAAGFTRFVTHEFPDPANLYYEVRP